MFKVRIRKVLREGEACSVEGCPVEPRGDLVVFEANGKLLLEMCGPCAAVVGDTFMAEARHVDLRGQRRLAGETLS